MLQAPDPLLQALKNHVLFRFIPDDFRHGQIRPGVVAPDTGESAVLHIQHGQVKAKLELVIEGDGVLRPILRFVVGAAFTLQDSRLPILVAGCTAGRYWPGHRGDPDAGTGWCRLSPGLPVFFSNQWAAMGSSRWPISICSWLLFTGAFIFPFLMSHSSKGVVQGDRPKMAATSLPPTV